jgi:hypothetical protein
LISLKTANLRLPLLALLLMTAADRCEIGDVIKLAIRVRR